MKKKSQSITAARLHIVGLVSLPVLAFILYALILDHVFIMGRDFPATFFLFTSDFLGQFTDHPGGVLIWSGRFAGQFAHIPALGALVVAMLVGLFAVLLHVLLAKRGDAAATFGAIAPAIVLMVLHSLTIRIVMDTLGLVAALGALTGHLYLRSDLHKRVYAGIMTPVLYVIVGGYVWFFVAWVTAIEWIEFKPRDGLPFKIAFPVLAVLMPLVAYRFVFPVSLSTTYATQMMFGGLLASNILVILLCVFTLLVPFWPRIAKPIADRVGSRIKFDADQIALRVTSPLLALLTVALIATHYNPSGRELARYVTRYEARDWDGILSRSREKPPTHQLSQFLANRALFESGALLDEMFSIPQRWGTRGLLFLPSVGAEALAPAEDDTILAMYSSDIMFDAGHAGMAYREAFNHLSRFGPTYRSIERLAECHIARGKLAAARKYVSLLESSLFHRDRAEGCRKLLDDEELAVKECAALRSNVPTVEFHMPTLLWSGMQEIVDSGHNNRMALEYMTAWRLLDKASVSLIQGDLSRFRKHGYESLPRHVQEGMFIRGITAGARAELQGYEFEPGIVERFGRFEMAARRVSGDPSASTELRREFGDSYLYYFITDKTPTFGNDRAYRRLADALLADGQFAAAAAHYRNALKIKPKDKRLKLDLSKALRLQRSGARKRTEGAEQ